jgi:hypothetical protein
MKKNITLRNQKLDYSQTEHEYSLNDPKVHILFFSVDQLDKFKLIIALAKYVIRNKKCNLG